MGKANRKQSYGYSVPGGWTSRGIGRGKFMFHTIGWHLVFHELSRVPNPLYTLGEIYVLNQAFALFFLIY